MIRHSQLKRSAFKREPRVISRSTEKLQADHESAGQAEISRSTVKPIRRGVIAPIEGFKSAPKDPAPVRSEPYRRLVAKLPCKFCGIDGYSQAAHPNTGKGAGTKTDDRLCFPLCADRPGQRGCHSYLDQGALLGKERRRQIEPLWGAATRKKINDLGLWPKNLPQFEGEDACRS
ncbi:hypothetical protein PSQ40_04835 [Curvibacter sp. HBC61]|uniref:Recombinase zinc beta ribbon domain-containing protein n=1 Tax=Curvibacter cyanobacteriorum TaxID=3026422 RepID=A0ABT5MX73_9BURK|nr:hypothetical protein [Curvibacter sp. HBC61]MDD0837891.1 hypothetical protein [Curvibacter sp. HBC61]